MHRVATRARYTADPSAHLPEQRAMEGLAAAQAEPAHHEEAEQVHSHHRQADRGVPAKTHTGTHAHTDTQTRSDACARGKVSRRREFNCGSRRVISRRGGVGKGGRPHATATMSPSGPEAPTCPPIFSDVYLLQHVRASHYYGGP